MPILKLENLGQHGIITDPLPTQVAPNAFTSGNNVRFDDGKVIRFMGHEQFFDPTDDLGSNWDGGSAEQIYHLLPIAVGANYYWIFCGLNDVGVYDDATDTSKEITNAGGDYTATASTVDWTSCIIGGVPVLNNGVDLPQFWDNDFGTPGTLAALTDFSNHASKCGALRAYKNYLVALDVTISGTRYPSLVKWSDSAAAGAVPTSWDESDETTDAGETQLLGGRADQNVGINLDCLPLRDTNIIYRDDSVWSMSFVGGTFVFAFRKIFERQGMLTRRCMAEFEGRHFVVGQGDVFVHDGTRFESVIDGKRRNFLYNNMDPSYVDRTFVFNNRDSNEMWVCYVENSSGDTFPNKALVWNWRYGTWGVRDLPSITPYIEAGIADTQNTADVWTASDGTWANWTVEWGSLGYAPQVASPVLATTVAFKADSTEQFNGSDYTAYVIRTDIPVGEQDEFVRIKAVYPRMSGGPVSIQIGAQMAPGGQVDYQASVSFTPGTDQKVDCRVTGTLLAIKIQTDSDTAWELSGLDVEYVPISRR